MKVEIPTVCPCCSSILERVNMQLFCRNDMCEGRSLHRISSFCKKIKIKGLAEKSIEKLNIDSIADLYSLDMDYLVSVLGKNGEKVYREIQESLSTDIGTLIGSLGIPLVGRTTASKITGDLRDINYSALPNKAKENLQDFITSDLWKDLINVPFNFSKKPAEEVTVAKTVCLTGKFPLPKAIIEEKLHELGYVTKETVTKALDLLITNDINSTSSKVTKARQYGISIKTLEEVLNEQMD